MKKNFIGTSGFSYAYWKNRFYPEKLPAAKWLEYYSRQFNTLELNNTFYRFPVVKNLNKMYRDTPADFAFSVKINQLITHRLRMKNAGSQVAEFINIVEEGLNDKLHCLLFQLPPSYRYNEENLENILESVPALPRHVIEFRHASWWNTDVFKTLKENKLTFCNVSFNGLPVKPVLTGPVFYQRMHGVPELFISAYTPEELEELKSGIPGEAEKQYIYFNNTMYEAGYKNAYLLQSLMEQ